MFTKDGYTERWYQASECMYSAVVEMNHPETQTIRQDWVEESSTRPTRLQKSSNHLLFNNDCSSRILTSSVTTMWLLYCYSSLLEVTSYVYIDVILEELFFFFHNKFKLFTVISDAPSSGIRLFNQSISVVMNLTSLHGKHAYYMQHKTIINDQFTLYQPY